MSVPGGPSGPSQSGPSPSGLLTPRDLGFPPKFHHGWRPVQEQAIESGLQSAARFIAQCVPTGGGKSGIAVALALMQGYRAAILTSTKGLQNQYLDDFLGLGMVDIRGRNNYQCKTMNCEEGGNLRCPDRRTSACPYYQAYERALGSQLVITNYAYWMAIHRFGEGLGNFDMLICDEAHGADQEVCDAMSVVFQPREVYTMLRADWPPDDSSMELWRSWSQVLLQQANHEVEALSEAIRLYGGSVRDARELARWKVLAGKLQTIASSDGPWVAESTGPPENGYRLDPVWARQYAEQILFRGIEKVFLFSATIVPYTLGLLGIGEADSEFQEYPATFPPDSSPLWYVPRMLVDFRTMAKPGYQEIFYQAIDDFIRPRLDRRGIIHTVSYRRASEILSNSEHAAFMLAHGSRDALQAANTYRHTPPPAILLSPSMSTGYDFPYCLGPKTLVLNRDLRWVPVGNLRVGDKLVAFDEYPLLGRRSRMWREAIVTSTRLISRPRWRLHFSDGTKVVCSPEHKWLVRRSGVAVWVTANDLRADALVSQIAKLLEVWPDEPSRDTGYLAAAFDGEGSFFQKPNRFRANGEMYTATLSYAQKQNAMLAEVQAALTRSGYSFRTYAKGTEPGMCNIVILRRADILRFLGEARPLRLSPKLDLDHLGCLRSISVHLVWKERLSPGTVVALQTTTGTLIAEGLATHNCDCEYQILCKLPRPDTRSKIMEARCKERHGGDSLYAPYITAQQLVQACGRGMRHDDDQCENYIFDNHFGMFLREHRSLFPQYFLEQVHRRVRIPEPLPKLARVNRAVPSTGPDSGDTRFDSVLEDIDRGQPSSGPDAASP